jgi:4-amino-4-deoxy-L-arabinose transferase-like glycosyltransferase
LSTAVVDNPASEEISSLRSRRRILYTLLLITFWAAIYIPALSRPALLDDADTVHAEAAKEMLGSSDWVTLHINNGIRYLEKAPLTYWTTAAFYALFGVSEWTTRFTLSLAVLALTLALYHMGRRVYESEEAGFYSALAIVTAFGMFIFTRFHIPDAMVALWLSLGVYFFWRTLEEGRPSRPACWGLAATTALNVLTKGFIGIVFPVAMIGIYLLLTRNLRHLLRMRLISSFLVFLMVALPWHVLAAVRNPPAGEAKGWLWFYVVNEHILRFLGKRFPKDYDTVPLIPFWLLVFIWLLPFSAFLIQAVGQIRGHIGQRFSELDLRGRGHLLFAVWAFTILLFFSSSTRQEYYLLPALPAFALLIGAWLARESAAERTAAIQWQGRISSAVLAVIGVLAFLAAVLIASQSSTPPLGADIAELMRQNPEKYSLSLGHLFDLTPQALGAFRGPLLGTGIALFLGTGLNWFFRRRGQTLAANLALAGMMVPLLLCANIGFQRFEPIMSSKQLALAIQKEFRPGDVIVVNGIYEKVSTLNFYTGQQLHMLNQRGANLWYGSLFPDAPKVFETSESFMHLWSSRRRVFLWTLEDKTPGALMPGNIYELARSGGKVILTNQTSVK